MELISEKIINCTREISRVKLDDGSTVEMIYYMDEEANVLETICHCVDTGEYVTDFQIIEMVQEYLRNMFVIRHGGVPEMQLEHKDESDFLGVFNTRKNRIAPLRVVK